jgi:hypothetical protein
MSSQPAGNNVINGFRFSLSATDPAPASDVLAATTGYLVPFTHDSITLVKGDGTLIIDNTNGGSVSLSFAAFTAGNVYRIFASDPSASGTPTLSAIQWQSITTPGASLAVTPATPGGFLVLSSDHTKRYVADVYCTANGAVNDATKDRGVFNVNNRILRQCLAIDTTNTWTMSNQAQHARNNNTTEGIGRFGVMIGLAQDAIRVSIIGRAHSSTINVLYQPAFGVDTSTSYSRTAELTANPVNVDRIAAASFTYMPSQGRHFFQAIESGNGTSTVWGGNQVAVLEAIVSM